VAASATDACSATVAGSTGVSSSVNWSVSAGSVSPTGLVTVPATAGTIVVKATSSQDPTKFGSYTITTQPSVTAVTVACASSAIAISGTDACTATVAGSANISNAVTWSTSAGTVNAAGLVTAPATAATFVVKATSVADPTKYGTYTITAPPPTVSSVVVRCALASVIASSTDACAATVTGSTGVSTGVTWSASAGSINAAGLLTAPATGGTIVVKATSVADATKSATYSITSVVPTVNSITVNCPAVSVTGSGLDACTSTVTGSTGVNTAVTWSVSAGTVTSTGIVTAPAADGTIVVKAVSVQDPTKSASFTITVSSKPTMSNISTKLSPTSVTVSWNSNVPTLAGINYGPTYNLTAFDATKYTSSPTYTLTGLTPGTAYKILLFGYNTQRVFGAQVVTFTTPSK
jgi:hypothetical protein